LQVRDNKEGEAVRSFLRAISYFDESPPSPSLHIRKVSTYKELSAIYSNWQEYQLQEKYSLLTLQIAIQQQDPTAIFEAYMSMGHMYEQQYIIDPNNKKTRDQAEKYYLQAIHTYTKNKDKIAIPSMLSYVANNLANLYYNSFPDNY